MGVSKVESLEHLQLGAQGSAAPAFSKLPRQYSHSIGACPPRSLWDSYNQLIPGVSNSYAISGKQWASDEAGAYANLLIETWNADGRL
jgi:hypothetical protein